MNTHEWALITFTILTEMSVGAFLVLGAVHFFVARKAGVEEADRMSDRVLIAIIVTLGLGMLASFFHLGNPLNAPKAVTNIATSWLSREILTGVIFAVIGLVFVAMQWFKVGSAALRNVIAWIAALVGVVLIYSQSQAYLLPTQPSWNTLATPINFTVATLLLGVLAIGAALVANYAFLQRKNPGSAETQFDLTSRVIRWIAVASIILLGIEFVVLPIYLAYLGTGSAAALASLGLISGRYSLVFILRLVLGFIGAGVLAIFLYQNATTSGKKQVLSYLAYGAFALVLIAEVCGRFIFYATRQGIGF
jgi:anaerobic dimethyl sulfoxide reductase subunit C (anchor subunit)